MLEGDFRDLELGGGGTTLRDLRTVITMKRAAETEGIVVGKLEAASPERIGGDGEVGLMVRFLPLGERPEASSSRCLRDGCAFPPNASPVRHL